MSNNRLWLNTVMIGECRAQMANLPANSIQCVVSSPPYWGLRDYGLPAVDWENGDKCVLGLEDTPEQFIDHIVEVFRSVNRVLRPDGVLFVNLGDSYCGSGRGGYVGDQTGLQGSTTGQDQSRLARTTTSKRRDRAEIPRSDRSVPGRKVSELLNMPHRVAEALSAAGWYWRSTIIWQKRSPMPESLSGWRWVRCRNKTGRKPVDWSNRPKAFQPGLGKHDQIPHGNYMAAGGDATVPVWAECDGCDKCRDTDGYVLRRGKWRPTNSHEYIFMFSKSKDYFCDSDAVAELAIGTRNGTRHKPSPKGSGKKAADFQSAISGATEKRNPRSVITLSSEPFKEAHFATFPSQLPKRLIEAATSPHGCCAACGACYAPIVDSQRIPTRPGLDNKIWKLSGADALSQRTATSPNLDPKRHVAVTVIAGYRKTCRCETSAIVPCVVFDPFGGSGTTAQAAKWLGRDYVIIEMNREYAELAAKRIGIPPRWAVPETPKRKPRSVHQKEIQFE